MKGYAKNGKVIIRHSYYDDVEKKYKIANFITGINAKGWNQKEQVVDLGHAQRSQAANLLISRHFSEIEDLLKKYHPNVAKEYYDGFRKHESYIKDDIRTPWKVSLSDIYSEYYEKYKDEKKIRKIKELQKNWIGKYFPDLKLYQVDRKWLAEYMAVISHLADNTQRDHVKILKRVLREARRSNHDLYINEDELQNPPTRKKKVVWLYLEELKRLEVLDDLSTMERKTLDCWLFRAYCGLRHNEMDQVDIKKILSGFIEIYDTKKKSSKSIEIPDPAVKILKRNKGKLPVLSQQSENRLIKVLARRAKINRSVYTSCAVDKKYKEGEFELWRTLTTHDARRTFASICYREGKLSLEVVRELLQHASTDQTLEYIGVSIRAPKIGSLFS